VNKPRVVYQPRVDASPETEVNVLAAVYRFILDCHAKKKGTRPGAHDDAERRSSDGAKTSIRERP
jgi:hypothetical protein